MQSVRGNVCVKERRHGQTLGGEGARKTNLSLKQNFTIAIGPKTPYLVSSYHFVHGGDKISTAGTRLVVPFPDEK